MKAQPRPACPRYPHLPCPGECQWQLDPDQCVYDQDDEPAGCAIGTFDEYRDAVEQELGRKIDGPNERRRVANWFSRRDSPGALANYIRRGVQR